MEIIKNKNLKELNTFHFDIYATEFAEFSEPDEIQEIFLRSCCNKWYLLSGGSNILFSGNYDGLILHPVSKTISIEDENEESVTVRASAGVQWDDFVLHTLEQGWYGLENLSLIPGFVGAAPVQNIGAYGVEVKDTIVSVEVYLMAVKKTVTLTNDECHFAYRDSIFKNVLSGEAIVISVLFKLSKKFTPILKYDNLISAFEEKTDNSALALREVIIEVRNSKLPDPNIIGNGGSFFKNPVIAQEMADGLMATYPNMPSYPDKKGVKIPAGWLIEQAGWKGYREGDAGVYDKQALVLVNHGQATPKEIIMLANTIIQDVKQKFGILVSPEINIL